MVSAVRLIRPFRLFAQDAAQSTGGTHHFEFAIDVAADRSVHAGTGVSWCMEAWSGSGGGGGERDEGDEEEAEDLGGRHCG